MLFIIHLPPTVNVYQFIGLRTVKTAVDRCTHFASANARVNSTVCIIYLYITISDQQRRIQDLTEGVDHGERELITGVWDWGWSPSGVQGQSPLWGSWEQNPPETESFCPYKRGASGGS